MNNLKYLKKILNFNKKNFLTRNICNQSFKNYCDRVSNNVLFFPICAYIGTTSIIFIYTYNCYIPYIENEENNNKIKS